MRRSSGFTLIEVALSVAILGVALTTLVALQSSYIRSYQHERNLMRASLIAQYLLSVWEGDDDMPSPGTSEKPLIPILKRFGYFDENDAVSGMEPEFDGWVLARNISNVNLPPLENVLRRVQLEVIWGPQANERFPVVYFVKSAELPGAEDTPEDADDEDSIGDEPSSPDEITPDGEDE